MVTNANNRARIARAEAEIAQWMNKSWQWNEERQVLNMKLRHSESDVEGLQTQLQGLTTRCQSAKSES